MYPVLFYIGPIRIWSYGTFIALGMVTNYLFGAVLFMCYGIYLVYATWWGYRLWLLNDSKDPN